MDMPVFAIESVNMRVSRERRGGEVRETRVLEVEGPGHAGGRNRAIFVFDAASAAAPVVGYIVGIGTAGVTLMGWLPAAAFDTYRAIVAAGGPLQVHYETRDATSGYLRRLALGRGNAALVASRGPWRGRPEAWEDAASDFAMPL
jgi:hypothetical protein